MELYYSVKTKYSPRAEGQQGHTLPPFSYHTTNKYLPTIYLA